MFLILTRTTAITTTCSRLKAMPRSITVWTLAAWTIYPRWTLSEPTWWTTRSWTSTWDSTRPRPAPGWTRNSTIITQPPGTTKCNRTRSNPQTSRCARRPTSRRTSTSSTTLTDILYLSIVTFTIRRLFCF